MSESVAHPPKREIFDVPARVNVDNKGVARPVEVYQTTDFGLYMSRAADHPLFSHLESWLLPRLGLRVSIFHFVPGHPSRQRLYLDVGDFEGPDPAGRWHAIDWYLDLIDVPGAPLELVDVDELFDAHRAGLLDRGDAIRAVQLATDALVGAARHGDVESWLATVGCPLTWRDSG
ncbi:DUF402 domain-containing protein [Williamsia sp. CHRR-6]|uniref:DUF402 domain-containing protein n=1 Tax=Williamsia sp. CHRR-6 TaxID=2835871 RepID=UPI001BDB197E|nr:DUF402 domain-containing protein [Williamsia sp. CHRR-6]MBT0565178.1 DUF402 domain-containing protein [Williamsia sp. CHRR-6]